MSFGGGYDISDAGASSLKGFVDIVNPLGGYETFANFVLPTVLDPIINLTANVDPVSGREIRREAFPNQNASAASLYWNNTSPTAVLIAKVLNEATGGTETVSGWADVSPNDIEFVYDFLTGGAGRFAQRTVEAPFRIAQGENFDEIAREVPMLRRIIGTVSERENLGAYIEGRDKAKLGYDELRAAMRDNDQERAAAARDRFAAEIRAYQRIRSIENGRRRISEQINAIRENDRMPEERKQQMIDRLDAQRQLLIAQGLQALRQAELI
jgi:hypothetical protein